MVQVDLSVKNIMSTNLVTFKEGDLVSEVCKAMAKNKISCVLIVKRGRPVGVISERDIVRKINARQRFSKDVSAGVVMSARLKSVEQSESIFEAVKIMRKNRIRRLPVMKRGRLVGLVTETDILRATTNLFKFLNESLVLFMTDSSAR